MDYTLSNAYTTDAGTGNRLHQQSAAVTTAVTDQDINGPAWELMSVIKGAGLSPVAFDKANPASYTQLQQAIQAMISGSANQDFKVSVRAATIANIASMAGGAPNTLDGVALAVNDRILVKDQATASQNGIYSVTALGTGVNGTWTRTTDTDGAGELTSGAIVAVEEGTINADSQWMLTTDGAITIGTTSLTFVRQGGSSSRQIQSITASVAANALTIGASNLSLDFRSATLTSGGVTSVSGSPSNLVVPSTATLGTTSAVLSDLYVLALNNAGAIELAVVNAAGGVDLSEAGLISTTAISGAATAANVVYSTTARASVAYRVIGLIRSTQAVAGTWATAPSLIQGAGGNALDSMMSLGYGQTWQNLTGSRAAGTTYYNTTGRPIVVSVNGNSQNQNPSIFITVNGILVSGSGFNLPTGAVGGTHASAIVPPGASYSVALGNNAISGWNELR